MGRWKKDEIDYTINLNHDERRGCIAIISKPILEKLAYPDQLTFIIEGKRIVMREG